MKFSISSNNFNIVNSGQVFLYGQSNEMDINVDAENGFNFSISFRFMNDNENNHHITQDIADDKIILNCYNFDGMGTGLSKPVNIARVNNKELYLMFWSYLEGKGQEVRSVKYTFFIEK